MMKNYRWLLTLVMLLCVAACGSAVEPEADEDPEVSTDVVAVDPMDERADKRIQWRTKVRGMTMWVDTTLQPEWSGERTLWILRGRVSKTLVGFRAYTPHGHPFSVRMPSARTFQVVLDQDEAAAVLAGERVLFDFFPLRDRRAMYSGTASFAPRFANWTGTTKLFVYRSLKPVLVGEQIRFRGRASARDGHELEVVYTDDELNPLLLEEGPEKWRFDFSARQLLLAADPPDEPVHFRVFDGAQRRLQKSANVELRLVSMGLTLEPVFEAWPREGCREEVAACLAELDDRDTEACGWATEVQACIGEGSLLPEGATPERFVEDLREEVERWYGQHQRDATDFDAPPLEEVLESIDVDNVHELDDVERGEYFDYDPEHYQIYWYPDPIFPGSDRVWYGVYAPSGKLRSIYVVN